MPDTIGAAEEQELFRAVKRATDLVDDAGMDPDAAIEKVARDFGFAPGKIRVLGHAFNTGRQMAQWGGGGSVLDKLASFPLCDPAVVVARIFGGEKAAGDAPAGPGCYAPPPAPTRGPAMPAADFEKVALDGGRAADAAGPTPQRRLDLAYGAVARQKRAADEARLASARADDEVRARVLDLVGYFKKQAAARASFADVEAVAVANHGAPGRSLMDLVYRAAHLKEARAGDRLRPVDNPERFSSAVARCVKAAQDAARLRAEAKSAFEKIAAVREEAFRPFFPAPAADADRGPWASGAAAVFGAEKAGSGWLTEVGAIAAGDILAHKATHKKEEASDPFGDAKEIEDETAEIRRTADKAMKKEAVVAGGSLVAAGIGGMLGKTLGTGPKSKDDLVEDAWMKLEDPAHEDELRKIRAKAMLTSMLTDPEDPISGHDPAHVSQVYNELAATLPRGSTQPALVRPLLRKKLEGHQEPFEAKEMLDIEKGLAQTKHPTPNTSLLSDTPDKLLG